MTTTQHALNPPIMVIRHSEANRLSPAFEKVLHDNKLPFTYLHARELCRKPTEHWLGKAYRGWIWLGGEMGANDEAAFPHIGYEKNLLAQLLKKHTPVLGICLGAQLMARALGGAIHRMKQKEIGWIPLKQTATGMKDSLFSRFAHGVPQFQWHQDGFTLPKGIEPLLSSDGCAQQAFRVNAVAVGVQFHPEITENTIDRWLDQSKSLTPKGKAAIKAETEQRIAPCTRISQQWFEQYLHQAYGPL
jgi:GMP synthase-like glutamine amidotransferase